MPRLPPEPDLDWTPEGAPRARAFGDTYFSREGGLAETEAVFLAGCGLPARWKGRARFTIGELGFGTGLNWLATWRAWRRTRTPHAILHMCSVEAFPLGAHDAARALAAFPEIAPLAEQLLARWPVRAAAPQRLWFPEDGVALTLIVGEAHRALAAMSGRFDAWYLDGFAPSRNAAMWDPALFRRIAALSAPDARAATFSVAGDVRRGLEAAGFTVEKKPGYGAKRERLQAFLPPQGGEANHSLYPSQPRHPKRVAIVGAGIAGAACAAALTRRGVETVVLDAARELGAGASGNPAGLVAPRLDRDATPAAELFLAAYLDAVATYTALGAGVFTQTGAEEHPGARGADVIAAMLADPPLPPDWIAALGEHAALYPQAGVLKPLAAIRAFLRGATIQHEAEVAALEQAGEGWRLLAPDGRAMLKADAVVLACGAALARFEPARFLPLQFSRGQLEWAPLAAPPPRAIQGDGYCAPHADGVVFGATFDRLPAIRGTSLIPGERGSGQNEAGEGARSEDRQRNLEKLRALAPGIAARLDPAQLTSRASIRVATPDRLPVAGLMPDAPAWLEQYKAFAHGRAPDRSKPAPALDGVYVIGGLGARGLTLAPLLGETIAASMFGEPQTLSRLALEAIHPARFLHRSLKKRVITPGG